MYTLLQFTFYTNYPTVKMSANLVCVKDYEALARLKLEKSAGDYYFAGADDETTLRANVDDFSRYLLRPRMLVDVTSVNLATTILGEKVSFPVGIAPTAMQKLAHPGGEVSNAMAAASANTIFVHSTIATTGCLELGEKVPNCVKWFQLYILKDRATTIELISRVEKMGYKALVLTVDSPHFGNRRVDARNRFTLPEHLRMANFDGLCSTVSQAMNKSEGESSLTAFSKLMDASVTWKDIGWLKSITHLPIIAKGILTGSDAKLAIEVGCKAVWVSNHGARQLDGVSSSICALREVVEAVQGKVDVYMDGGIRSGTDVLKALALGAKAVFIGRPALYGLAVNGEQGVKDVLNILKKELRLSMQLAGVTDVNNIPADLVANRYQHSNM